MVKLNHGSNWRNNFEGKRSKVKVIGAEKGCTYLLGLRKYE